MSARQLITAILFALLPAPAALFAQAAPNRQDLLVGPVQVTSSPQTPAAEQNTDTAAPRIEGTQLAALAPAMGDGNNAVVSDIVFVGLRRISPEALRYKMLCREGQPFSAECTAQDTRALGRLGWFDSVRVEGEQVSPQRVRLTFFVPELAFLTGVEYSGSRLLSKAQIEKLLAEKKMALKLGAPENRVVIHQIADEIEGALRDLGHTEARVAVLEQLSTQATVRVRFEIEDGPHVRIGRLNFTGNPAIPEKRLRRQMRQLRPGAIFAGLRGKDAYTAERFEEDREHLLAYYQNHGYPEARVGAARVSNYEQGERKWLPRPHTTPSHCLSIEIPVEAGALYKFGAVQTSESLRDAVAGNRKPAPVVSSVQPGQGYSAQAVENLRRGWQGQLRSKLSKREAVAAQTDALRALQGGTLVQDAGLRGTDTLLRTVETTRAADATTHTMRINFHLSDSPPYTVSRLEFAGTKHFPDRYFRKRIVLKEGAAYDDRALEAGIARLGRTGYFKPIKKEDIRVDTNDATHTANVTLRIEELGKQRVSLVGGRGQFGSTLGIAYTLYNVLDREELLSSRIEGGPESVQLALGFAKEGFFGSRGTLALSVFNTLLRPRLMGTVKGPFFKQKTEGASADWSYALSATDTVSVDYGVTRFQTQYSLALPAGLTGLPAGDVRADSSSHALGLGWQRDTGSEKISLGDSVSGGWLGGSENLVRTKAEYARIFHDDIFDSRNAWAIRTSFSAVGSYSGTMPPYARWFVGDQYVRGLQDGDLGPLGVVSSISSSGATTYSAAPVGANAISAINAEYRMPLGKGTEAATFFDLGSGRLLPNWLGPSRPSIIDATNGVLHGSTGVELRWNVPGVGVPVRVYYALNVLRLNRRLALPDGSLFAAHNRFSALGWGLGSMF